MSFLSTAWRAVELAREYDGALEAAMVAAKDGFPLRVIVQRFAEETESKLDDRAVEVLVDGATRAVVLAQRTATWASSLAAWVEDNGPRIVEGARRLGVQAIRLENRLESLL